MIDYDADEDIFSLFRKGNKVKFSYDISLPRGDIVVDYDFRGQVVGIEFFNASSYFPLLKKVSIFTQISGDFKVQYGPQWAQISYEIYFPGEKKPISNFIAAPYSKKLILQQ